MFNYKKNILYFKIPKCASTTIDSVLENKDFIRLKYYPQFKEKEDKWPHLNDEGFTISSYLKFHNKLPDLVDQSFKFTIIRDPYKRIISSWLYLAPELSFKDFMEYKYFIGQNDNFEIMKTLSNDELYEVYRDKTHKSHKKLWEINRRVFHTEPMVNSIIDKNNKININYIGILDTLKDDLNFILYINHIPIVDYIPEKNKKNINKKYELTPEDKELINKYFKYDIKLYNLVKSLNKIERINFDYNLIFN